MKKKRCNIYIINKKHQTPLSLVDNKNINLFIDTIASSFLYLLKDKNINNKWAIKWQNECATNKINDTKCLNIIKKYIIDNKSSVPQKIKHYCINFNIPSKNLLTTFTGITLDVITSYIYLIKKYNMLSTSITENFITNDEIYNYYKKIGIIKNLNNEYLNFEIFWIFQNIFFPSNIESIVEIFLKNDKQILAIPIAIEIDDNSHANILIIDKFYKTIERFEPNGSEEPNGLYYNKNLLDYSLKSYFLKLFKDYEYLHPYDFLPIIGFQFYETTENKKMKRIGDPGGFCVAWCVWYLEQRLKYLVEPKQLANKLIIKIRVKDISFKNLIRNYANEILIERDNILNLLKFDINDIINDNLSNEDLQKIQNMILIEIKKNI